MTETQTFQVTADGFTLDFAPADWGFYDCARLATHAEMTAAGCQCTECGVPLEAKHEGGMGKMIGWRIDPDNEWTWLGPWCKKCDIADYEATHEATHTPMAVAA